MGLKRSLEDKIKEAGQLSIFEIYELTEDLGYRQSNAERRLRESKNLEPVFDQKHKYIMAYRWTGKEMGSPEVYEDKRQVFNFN